MSPDDRRAHLAQAADAVPDGVHGGRDYCVALARITDAWVIDLFERALVAHPTKYRVALLAVGGYGRGELSPYSDLDLLLVHGCKPRKVPAEIEPVASALWYPLWDAGVKLGHAVRRVDEQLELVGRRPRLGDGAADRPASWPATRTSPPRSSSAGRRSWERSARASHGAPSERDASASGRVGRRRLPARARPQERPRRAP